MEGNDPHTGQGRVCEGHWVLTHIVSAITFAEPKKVDVVFSVLPVCCILRCLGEVIFLCVIL